jgi:hypothetical protein
MWQSVLIFLKPGFPCKVYQGFLRRIVKCSIDVTQFLLSKHFALLVVLGLSLCNAGSQCTSDNLSLL